MEGMTGLIDWALHGQVSRLVKRGILGQGESALLPGDPGRKRPSFLFVPTGENASALVKKIVQLSLRDITVAESTFPEDFLSKLKQTLQKEGIRCTKLEP
jgi:hypothetical protein